MLGRSIDSLVPDRLRHQHLEHRARYMAAPKARAMGAGRELLARRKDGSEVPVEVALTPIHTREGLQVLASVADISDRRRAEVEMQLLRTEVAHAGRVSAWDSWFGIARAQPAAGAILRNAEAAELFSNGIP
jgi:PAS domain-containing protein